MTKQPKPIRELMPDGYLRIIAHETMAYPSTISEAVVSERTNSKLWPVIERLAKETDSKAYKERMDWLAAHRGRYSGAAA